MPLLSRKRLLLAKLETTVGTDPTPVVGSDAILVRNIEVTPLEVDTVNRELIRMQTLTKKIREFLLHTGW